RGVAPSLQGGATAPLTPHPCRYCYPLRDNEQGISHPPDVYPLRPPTATISSGCLHPARPRERLCVPPGRSIPPASCTSAPAPPATSKRSPSACASSACCW